jgi:imidazole glycerol-phosphate synthase subunit HisH
VTRHVTIVDYGLGNLHSVVKAFEFVGATVEVDVDSSLIPSAHRLVLPGVGAFSDGMSGLRERQQDRALRKFAANGGLVLGICLGAQLLLDESEEFGRHQGLGLIRGHVVKISGSGLRVPHVGWARLFSASGGSSLGGLLEHIAVGSWAYFIHSYEMKPTLTHDTVAVCGYGTQVLTAAVQNGNVIGLQFHPEKSGSSGLAILQRFAGLPTAQTALQDP